MIVRFPEQLANIRSSPNRIEPRITHEGVVAAARFELDTVDGVIPAVDWFHVVDGVIVALCPCYDLRPLLSAAEAV
jgi:hypothetical protein